MESIGDTIVSEYLSDKYYRYISGRKEKKVNRIAQKYPCNTIDEAKQAIELYKTRKVLQSNINLVYLRMTVNEPSFSNLIIVDDFTDLTLS